MSLHCLNGDCSTMDKNAQVDSDAGIRAKGLTILAHILAMSLARKQAQHHEDHDIPGNWVDCSEGYKNEPDADDGVGDAH